MLADPGPEQKGRIARVAKHVDMRATVAQPDQEIRIVQNLLHAIDTMVERRQRKFDLQIVLQSEIEERIDAIFALRFGDVSDALSLQRLERTRAYLVDSDPRPVAEGHRPFQLLSKPIPKCSIGIDFPLRRLGLIREHLPPRRERREREWIAHIDFAGKR